MFQLFRRYLALDNFVDAVHRSLWADVLRFSSNRRNT